MTKASLILMVLVFTGSLGSQTTQTDERVDYLYELVEDARQVADTLQNTWPLRTITVRVVEMDGWNAAARRLWDGSGLIYIHPDRIDDKRDAVELTLLHEMAHLLTSRLDSSEPHDQTWCDSFLTLAAQLGEDIAEAARRARVLNPECVLRF